MTFSYSKTGTSREILEDLDANPPVTDGTHETTIQAVKETLNGFFDKFETGGAVPEGGVEPAYSVYASGHEDPTALSVSVSVSKVSSSPAP